MKSKIHVNKTIEMMSKKLVLILAVILMPFAATGQSIFDKYEDLDNVTTVVVNKKMFSMLAKMGVDVDDPEAQEIIDMAKNITGLKVFTTGDEKISADMKATVKKYLNGSDMEELMRVKDGDQTVNFYIKEGKDENHVKELLMFVNGIKEMTQGQNIEINGKKREIETVLFTLTGDIDLRKIAKLTEGMNVPGGEQLKKAQKGN
ncbi:DUF4252 domain-containing protein [Ichthyenterobacterium sp. W332]|uniref:DUF4252 domain-containing protein n=1 Tax=Microcosmobacter mediterraneus TaxID=3075607 RepID=A0ABU2YKC4_9FLAO|nr:DUF4252 domain-containing protein [Ichthyenterobacterium sp. W332]MDT0557680.1 DUF4252 domain-containing protein [Ichthyenterobacterium sp. W332]